MLLGSEAKYMVLLYLVNSQPLFLLLDHFFYLGYLFLVVFYFRLQLFNCKSGQLSLIVCIGMIE